jgi:hypothetical protein
MSRTNEELGFFPRTPQESMSGAHLQAEKRTSSIDTVPQKVRDSVHVGKTEY